MGWIIIRRKQDQFQLYMDRNMLPSDGEWRSSGNGLPLVFQERWRALHKMYYWSGKEPDWNYEVDEYLR